MPKYAGYVDNIIEAMSIKYNNRVYEMQSQGIDVTVLSAGEAYFDIPLYPFDDLPFPDIYHYSHSRGILGLRKQLAQYYGDQYGVHVNPDDEIIITSGSKIAIHMALMTILDPGDEVVFHEPAWVSYPEQTLLCHGVPVRVPYTETIFEMEKYITEKTKVLIINNPNNPSGRLLTKKELDHLHDLANRHDIFLLSDEAYSDYVLEDEAFISLGAGDPNKEHSIICNSMSKNHGISGWRIGYVIANNDLTYQILKVNQHLMTCPATILESYLENHFYEILSFTKPQIQEVVRKRKAVGEYMDEIGLVHMYGTGTFYHFVSIENSCLNSEAFCDRLLSEYKVSTVAGIGYGKSCDKFIRVSVGTQTTDRIQNGLSMIKRLISETDRSRTNTSDLRAHSQ